MEFLRDVINRLAEKPVTYTGYLGPQIQWDQAYIASLTREEAMQVKANFDPQLDNCHMDTLARLFPEKLEPYEP